MGPAKLLFVVESGTDVRLVEGLAESFDLTVLARRIRGGVEVSQVPDGTIRIITGPASRVAFALAVAWHLAARTRAYDRVIVQGYGVAALAANLIGRFARIPVTMLVCSPVESYYRCRRDARDPRHPYRPLALAGLVLLARANARLGRNYVVLSRYLEQVVRGHGTRAAVRVVPVYGVDTDLFRPSREPRHVLRAKLGLPHDAVLAFFSSRIAPEKDGATVLEALRLLRKEGRDVRLLHRSGGYREFVTLAEQHDVADAVIATDAAHPVRELPLSYQASDLCIQASRDEGLGFSPLEALACEVPVVATAVGGLRETIVDGVTGWTYPLGDAGALAAAMAALLDHPEEALRRARAGRAMVMERFERRAVFFELREALTTAAPDGAAPA
jgi:glycosyltransferase involved in cell wall biosynthesis